MPELVLDKVEPVLDMSIEIIRAFDHSKDLCLRIPREENNNVAGLVLDSIYLLYRFMWLRTAIQLDRKEHIMFKPKKPDKYLKVYFDPSLTCKEMTNAEGHSLSLLLNERTQKKISVRSYPLDEYERIKFRGYKRSSIEEILASKNILPEEKSRAKLRFVHNGPFSIKTYLKYQDIYNDPASFSREHYLKQILWKKFSLPISWKNEAVILGLSLDTLLGKKTQEQIIEQIYPIKEISDRDSENYKRVLYRREKFFMRLKRNREMAFELIRAFLEGRELGELIIKNNWCPERYVRLYLSNFGKGIFHYRDFKNDELDDLIKNYNIFYAGPKGFPYASRKRFREIFDMEETKRLDKRREKSLRRKERKNNVFYNNI